MVFDTNVLYSALAAKGFCEEVVDEAVAECDIVWSNALKQELESLVTRRHKIGPATRIALEAYGDLCEFVEPEPLDERVCRDEDDDGTQLRFKRTIVLCDARPEARPFAPGRPRTLHPFSSSYGRDGFSR